MEKKRLFKIMSKADRDIIISIAEDIKKKKEIVVVKTPEKVLTMIKMREPVKESLIYLGEVIVTEATVSIDGVNGTAVAMGDDYEKTLGMAIIDAAFNCNLFENEEQFLALEKEQTIKDEKENAMFKKTMVNFHSMDSEAQKMKKIHDFDEVFDGQKVFRIVLEGMSNPGRVLSIKEQAQKMYGENPAFLAQAMTLLDNEVSYFTCGNQKISEDISLLTLAKETAVEDADYIFVEKEEDLKNVLEKAKIGTLADPQQSATILVKTGTDFGSNLAIYGAGVDQTMQLTVPEVVKTALRLRDEQVYEYPQGVDFIFVTEDERILCIPRLVLREGK